MQELDLCFPECLCVQKKARLKKAYTDLDLRGSFGKKFVELKCPDVYV